MYLFIYIPMCIFIFIKQKTSYLFCSCKLNLILYIFKRDLRNLKLGGLMNKIFLILIFFFLVFLD